MGDNEYGMVIGSVKGGSVSDQVSKVGQKIQKHSPDKSSNWSVLSEQTKNLVNLQVLIDREIIMDSIN